MISFDNPERFSSNAKTLLYSIYIAQTTCSVPYAISSIGPRMAYYLKLVKMFWISTINVDKS
jgi:hypothetical protein